MTDRVRPAQESDGPWLRALDRETWHLGASPAPVPAPDAPFFNDRHRPEDTFVAVDGEDLVGYVILEQAASIPSHAHVLTINGLAVSPHRHGEGWGRTLVEAAVAEARRRGARKVTLRVLGPNEPARRVYRQCGFAEEGTLTGEFLLDGVLVDDVQMARWLD